MIQKFEEIQTGNVEKEEISTAGKVIKVFAGLTLVDKILGKINSLIGRNYINQIELKQFLLSGDIVELWGTKLDGTKLHRQFEKTIDGPGGRAMRGCRYWSDKYNYLILWSNTDDDFRTIVLRNVEKVRIGNKTYLVK